MGQVEDYGRFARGAKRASGWQGGFARVMVWLLLAGLVGGLVTGAVSLVLGR